MPGLQAYTATLSFSGGCWGLKPGLHTRYTGPPQTEPHPQPSMWALLWRLNYKHKGSGTSGALQFTEEMHALQWLRWGGLMFHPVQGARSGNICMNSLLVLTEWGSVCTLCPNPLILSPPPPFWISRTDIIALNQKVVELSLSLFFLFFFNFPSEYSNFAKKELPSDQAALLKSPYPPPPTVPHVLWLGFGKLRFSEGSVLIWVSVSVHRLWVAVVYGIWQLRCDF